MEKSYVLAKFNDILSKTGMDEVVSISENENEIADIMIYSQLGCIDYFATDGRALFPFAAIRNILYKFSENEVCVSDGKKLQFVIELEYEARYFLEFGDYDKDEGLKINGEYIREWEKIKATLEKYNTEYEEKLNKQPIFSEKELIEKLIQSTVIMIVEGLFSELDDSDIEEIKKEIWRYIDENPSDKDFLIYYAYEALTAFLNEVTDPLDVKRILRKIILDHYEVDFKRYILEENSFQHQINEDLYVQEYTEALRIMNEVKGDQL